MNKKNIFMKETFLTKNGDCLLYGILLQATWIK